MIFDLNFNVLYCALFKQEAWRISTEMQKELLNQTAVGEVFCNNMGLLPCLVDVRNRVSNIPSDIRTQIYDEPGRLT